MLEVNDKNQLVLSNNVVEQIVCPVNKTTAGNNICDFIIFHYTATPSLRSAHNTFLNPDTKVSWHLTIDRDGTIYQLYDFRKITWHAGTSQWTTNSGRTYVGMNRYSIGIEMINAGPLTFDGSHYRTWTGSTIRPSDVFTDGNGRFWHKYTDEQILVAKQLSKVLKSRYKCIDILGHEEISPGRKQDPGPAFWQTLAEIRKQ